MDYVVAFDASSGHGIAWSFLAPGILFVLLGVAVLKKKIVLPTKMSPESVARGAKFFLGFAVLWTTVAAATMARDYFKLKDVLVRDQAEVLEGRVTNFRPMPWSGHPMESFTVCGVTFSYSDFVETGAFNNATSHRGPIREGLWVRISHVGNAIARLEIARSDPKLETTCTSEGGRTRR
jgi:hypothetical protein